MQNQLQRGILYVQSMVRLATNTATKSGISKSRNSLMDSKNKILSHLYARQKLLIEQISRAEGLIKIRYDGAHDEVVKLITFIQNL